MSFKINRKEVGWIAIVVVVVYVIIFLYGRQKKSDLALHPAYVKGISMGIKGGARGNLYLYYKFDAYGKEYEGSVTKSFCNECSNCCNEGDTVIVRYERGKPENNDLVVELPEGESFEED